MFALSQDVTHYQLTVHYINYNNHYGALAFKQHYYDGLEQPERMTTAMRMFVQHYGHECIRNFLHITLGLAA